MTSRDNEQEIGPDPLSKEEANEAAGGVGPAAVVTAGAGVVGTGLAAGIGAAAGAEIVDEVGERTWDKNESRK